MAFPGHRNFIFSTSTIHSTCQAFGTRQNDFFFFLTIAKLFKISIFKLNQYFIQEKKKQGAFNNIKKITISKYSRYKENFFLLYFNFFTNKPLALALFKKIIIFKKLKINMLKYFLFLFFFNLNINRGSKKLILYHKALPLEHSMLKQTENSANMPFTRLLRTDLRSEFTSDTLMYY